MNKRAVPKRSKTTQPKTNPRPSTSALPHFRLVTTTKHHCPTMLAGGKTKLALNVTENMAEYH
eukprot:11218928-Lingulodinium_polyedra.AAC.1